MGSFVVEVLDEVRSAREADRASSDAKDRPARKGGSGPRRPRRGSREPSASSGARRARRAADRMLLAAAVACWALVVSGLVERFGAGVVVAAVVVVVATELAWMAAIEYHRRDRPGPEAALALFGFATSVVIVSWLALGERAWALASLYAVAQVTALARRVLAAPDT